MTYFRNRPDDCGTKHIVYNISPDGGWRCMNCGIQLTENGIVCFPFTFHKDFDDATYNDFDDDDDVFPGHHRERRPGI